MFPNAMAYGKQAAKAIDKQLMDADRWEELFPPMRYDQTVPKEVSESRRNMPPHLPVPKRANSFAEVVAVLSAGTNHGRSLPLPAL